MDRRISNDKWRFLVVLFLTASVFLVELIVSYITNSMALVAHCLHMLTDNIVLEISFIALRIASKNWSINTFGCARAKILGSLINALILLPSSFLIILEALNRLIISESIHQPVLVIYVGVLGLIVNIIGLFLFHGHGSGRGRDHFRRDKSHSQRRLIKSVGVEDNACATGTDNDNNDRDHFQNSHTQNERSSGQINMRGIYLHFFADAIGSVNAIVSTLIVWLTEWEYRYYMDPALSILMAIIILHSAWPLLYESALILLQTAPTHIQLDDIQGKLREIEGVLAVHELHVWQLTEDKIIASAHIKLRCTNLLEYMELSKTVKIFFHNEGIHSTTIQLEFVKFELQNQTPVEDCELDCSRTNTSCQLLMCCGPTKQSHDTSSVNTSYLCRKRRTISNTTNTINRLETDLIVDRNSGKNFQIITMICLTACFFLVEVIVGYSTNSITLIANSFHMLTSIIALIVSYVSLNTASKKWLKNTFGSARAEILGSLINSLFLVALCFQITLETIKRFIEEEPISQPKSIVVVGVTGLILNIIGLFFFHGKSHSHKSFIKLESAGENGNTTDDNERRFYDPHNHSHNELNKSAGKMDMRRVYLNFLANAIGSVIVIISASIIWLTEWEYYDYVDPAFSIIMVIIFLHSVSPLLKESILILLQTVPDHIQTDNIQKRLEEINGILGVHELHVWQLTGDIIIASVHIRCASLFEYTKLAERVKIFFHHEGIHSITIQPEFVKVETPIDDCVLDCPKTSTLCQLKTCCGSTKQDHNTTRPVDTPYLSRKRKDSSVAIDTTNCSHTDLTVNKNKSKQIGIIVMICLTAGFFFVEIIVGYSSNSMSLVADSFHMLSDILALAVSYIALNMATKKWSKNTFGWARAEVLGSLVNALFLAALCFTITLEAIGRFIEIKPIIEPKLIVVVGVLGLILNIIGLFLFRGHGDGHGHGHSHGGKSHSHKSFIKLESAGENANSTSDNDNQHSFYVPHNHSHDDHSAEQMNMRGVYLHFLADAIGSVIVILSALVVWLTDWDYRHYMDPGLSVILVVIILHAVWPLMHDSAMILLQTVPTHIQLDDIREKLLGIDGVLAVHELHVWQLTGDKIIASAHIKCTNLADYMDLAERVKLFFHDEGIHSTTIQPEFVNIEKVENCSLACPKTDTSCTIKTCCETTKQDRDAASPVDTPCDVWDQSDIISVTIDTTDSPQTIGLILETQV